MKLWRPLVEIWTQLVNQWWTAGRVVVEISTSNLRSWWREKPTWNLCEDFSFFDFLGFNLHDCLYFLQDWWLLINAQLSGLVPQKLSFTSVDQDQEERVSIVFMVLMVSMVFMLSLVFVASMIYVVFMVSLDSMVSWSPWSLWPGLHDLRGLYGPTSRSFRSSGLNP